MLKFLTTMNKYGKLKINNVDFSKRDLQWNYNNNKLKFYVWYARCKFHQEVVQEMRILFKNWVNENFSHKSENPIRSWSQIWNNVCQSSSNWMLYVWQKNKRKRALQQKNINKSTRSATKYSNQFYPNPTLSKNVEVNTTHIKNTL